MFSPLSLSLKSGSPISLAAPSPRAYRSKASPTERPPPRQEQPHMHGPGIDLSTLVGRILTRVRRSRAHPSLTLHFADGGAVQVRVVGYDPQYRGIPKTLESDSPVLNPASGATDVKLTVKHAAMITLSDKAFQMESGGRGTRSGTARESRWTQKHAAFAVKGWHCIWATLAEYDEKDVGTCVFRNFADVYVDSVQPTSVSPTSRPPARSLTRVNSPSSVPHSGEPTLDPAPTPKSKKPKRRARKNKKTPVPQARW
ncbi:hypothetical protein BN946_scf184775.g23 [Trametes cinnabarina]|uniref:Uncharacterized protein n=1 Tax=Pycnoporus cinnabarinus TaxID=5643 RepID=A0A060SS46_PYCCI|nr:hypothetical protein BN946_scf184775.g23 [Trametes cinnabarina]